MQYGVTSLLALCLGGILSAAENPRLINGQPVLAGEYEEVVRITTGNSACTATIVGPRVIITAAHCARTGATSTFKVNGVTYSAKITRSSLYPGKDHDIALGLTSKDIENVTPASIGGTAVQGATITLLGYGCTQVGGGGGNDGTLRVGESEITGFYNYDMVSSKSGGGALCFGDSGGPAFIVGRGRPFLLGVNSKGNIKNTNYNTRTDLPESKQFLENFAKDNNVDICGVNVDCPSPREEVAADGFEF